MNSSQIDEYVNFFYKNADTRMRDKFLMGSPYKIFFIYASYVIIVTKILPKFMENRKPIDYHFYSFIHNSIIYARSIYFVTRMSYLWFYHYSWTCQVNDRSNSWIAELELQLAHEFVISKFIYTFQSVIIEMSKKSDEYTTYVWIHHSHFPIMMWVSANFYPGGHGLFIYYANVCEHFVQLSIQHCYVIFKLKFLRPYLKRIYTFLTLLQVIAMFWHSSQLLFYNDCGVPKILGFGELCCLFYIAFFYFYYLNKRELGIKARQQEVSCEKSKNL